MANNVNNKIGCSAGKTTIVDPNNFDGHDSSSNISVPLEDLNISVVLRTFRKGRTVLTDDGDDNTRESSKTVEINFIEGSDINGKKVLTTKFTDLTVVGDAEFNDETLGITSIDIDFNSAYAPMVNINFIDVRGSSIFQNEENISGNNTNNKYATFFQLPYPLFELEVKGYYGKPVTYCLHMLKFTSKFNSKTGNFEIQCQFVGYTYAMLSDMLIGYLKAIPFTKIGAEKYEKYNSTKTDKVITLVDLMLKISKINEGVEKIASNSENSKLVNATTEANDELDAIQNIINNLGSGLDYDNKTIKDKYNFVIKLSQTLTELQKNVIELYKKNVEAAIDKFNELNAGATLTANDFKSFDITGTGKGFYSGITKGGLNPASTTDDTTLSQKLGSPKDLPKLKKDIYTYIKANYEISDNLLIDVYNLELLFEKIEAARTAINANGVKAKEDLALELKDKVTETLGFEPTVRKIVEIFTTAIEVFMETIYEVSRAAEAKDNTDRQAQLEKKFTKDLLVSDNKKEYVDAKKFFPWPDYREKNEKTKSYIEKYLGEAGVLENPKDVNELVFIDDLLAAFIKAQKASEEAKANEETGPTLWYPVNPLDSNVFVESEPYTRSEILNNSDITRLMVIRGMTFLGYSNDASILTEPEILGMAQIEAEAILRTLNGDSGAKIKQTLAYLNLDFIKKITGTINGVERPVIKFTDKIDGETVPPFYYYDYIFKSNNNPDTHKLIPITQGFDKTQWGDGTSESKLKDLSSDEKLFLTNYSESHSNTSSARFNKNDDGGTYVKILKPEYFSSKLGTLLPAPTGVTTESNFILSKLKEKDVDSSAGFNSFGGPLGVQQFVNMDFGGQGTDGLPLMYVFYKDFDNGLATNRKNSGIEQKISKNSSTVSKYDLNQKSTTNVVYEDKENAYKTPSKSFYVHTNLGKNRTLFNSFLKGDKELTYPYIELRIMGDNTGEIREPYSTGTFSLFGSKYYYLQDLAKCIFKNGKDEISAEKYAKGLLFLHTLPFNLKEGWSHDPFGPNEIKHLFDKKAGFIHAPRLWCAYIGSILWRISPLDPILDDDKQIIGGGRGKFDPMIYKKSCDGETFQVAKNDEYFPKVLDIIGDLIEMDATFGIFEKEAKIQSTHVLLKLPSQVKEQFKKSFFDFINGTDGMISFDDIKQKLEIWSNTSASFCNFVGNLHKNKKEVNDEFVFNTSLITTNSNVMNIDSYSIISPVYLDYSRNSNMDYLFLELKGDYSTNKAVTTLIDALTQEVIIVNTNWKIWGDGLKVPGNESSARKTEYEAIYVYKPIFDLYFNTIIQKLKEAGDAYSSSAEKKQALQEVFGTSNEDTIKLQLYRTCKNIHDKWLSGTVDPNNIIFQCGSGRNAVDTELAKQYGNTTTRLIDSFRFVSRSFRDIGSELYINPLPINDYLIENQNTSSYDAISSMLASNNFDFVALPSFINFKNPEELESLFKPYGNYGEAIANGSCGPSFVCVYVGQKSKHLDFKNSQFPNDSFDLRCNDGNLDVSVPQDFTTNNSEFEDPVAVFTVKYGQQNQNIFKDVELDQSEFTETDESIQIQDDISQKGSETNRTIAGQNLYNVYSVRSYTAQIEMMGNAMIQPMMYFQLDNIPMFHGAYMITRVKHSLTPNSMSTNFTGVRIKISETPLIDAMDLYMSFLDTLDTSAAGTGTGTGGGGGGGVRGSLSPLTMTIYENGGLNGRITAGNIKTKNIPKIEGIDNLKITNKDENQILDEAVNPLVKMLTAWVVWMKANGFKGSNGKYASITSVFRDYDKQVAVKKEYGNGAATPGSSPHGWGVAVDFQFYKKDGSIIGNTKNTASSFNTSSNPALKWLLDNSYVYGWVLPYSLRDQAGLDEHWHFEYHGTAAVCLMQKNPTTYGFKVDVTKKQDASVLNPLTKEGKRAVYTSCDYKAVKDVGDGTEKSTNLTDAESKENQKKTKVFFKSKGLTKEQSAGIMGNIQQESRFNPGALNKKDLNGYASFGLIQWNEKYSTRQEVGSTLEAQLNYLIGMSTYKKWANLSEPKTSVETSTYEFARLVEICHKCNKTFQIYKDSYQYVRTQFANDFFKRFNDKNDPLYW